MYDLNGTFLFLDKFLCQMEFNVITEHGKDSLGALHFYVCECVGVGVLTV